jgi:uncharacterized membrane protein HdeD (DUF308 family)
MSACFATTPDSPGASRPRALPRRIATVRAVLALAWAAAVIVAVGHDVPTTASDLPVGLAALLASYPLIDAVASTTGAKHDDGTPRKVSRINAAISATAVIAIAITAFGSDAGATLASFGAWAAISGAIQLGVAVRRRRFESGQLPMIVSGGLSTIAGLGFIAQSGGHDARVSYIGGYMAVGAVLYLLWVLRAQAQPRSAR